MDQTLIYCIIVAAAVVAGAIQNIAGFGASVILLMVLPRFFNVLEATTLTQTICTGTTIMLAFIFRKYIEWKKILLPGIAFMVAAVFTISQLKKFDLAWLGAALGLFLLILSLYYLFWQKKIEVHPTPLLAVAFGLLSGVLSGLFSIGATLMAMYFLAVTEDRNHYMANLQLLLAVNNVVSLYTRAATGILTASLILPSLIGFGGLLLGHLIGSRIAGKLDGEKLKRFVYVLVGVTGIETLIKQLMKIFG